MFSHVRNLLAGGLRAPRREVVRGALGAAVGIAACGLIARWLVEGRMSFSPLLAAPIGASAVLVFALPASPLAQPRAVIGGNMLAAFVGVACGLVVPDPLLAAALAVGAAIFAMSLLGCLHPPGGAMALGAALAASSSTPLGFDYPLVPVGLCSVLLVVAASVYGRLTGHAYPRRLEAAPSPHRTQDRPPTERFGYTRADLDQALAQYGDLLDVRLEDLDALFRKVELQAHRRLHAAIPCADIMSRDVIALPADQAADLALARLQAHELRTAPVVDARGRVLGLVRRAELLAGGARPVAGLADPVVHTVRPTAPIEALLPLLSSGATHEVLVTDEDGVLVGIVTQTDLLAVLYRAHVVEAVASAQAA
ncbi:HPP family protein [Brevundimonas faecalis]|uniref:CBS domain-containing membrane protein n=1 Tax=Brevundimonas faecalis TaxID=947378 RepID=A0ABV2R688_9CAUL